MNDVEPEMKLDIVRPTLPKTAQILLSFALKHMDLDKNKELRYVIKTNDMQSYLSDNSKKRHDQIIQAIKSLRESTIILNKDQDECKIVGWLEWARIEKDQVTIKFHKALRIHLKKIKEYYLRMGVNDISSFRSKYTFKIYELILQNAGKRELVVSLPKFKFHLQHSYDSVYNLAKRLLTPSIDEINRATPLNVSWEYIKTKQGFHTATTHIRFKIMKDIDVVREKIIEVQKEEHVKDLIRFLPDEIKNNSKIFKTCVWYICKHYYYRGFSYVLCNIEHLKKPDNLDDYHKMLARALQKNEGGYHGN